SGASSSFGINAAGLDHFIFNTIGTPQTAGVPFVITITGKDAFNNTATSYSGSNSLSDSTGTISPSSTGSFSSGTWTGSVTITKAQSGVTVITSGGGKSGTSSSFTVNFAPLDHFTFGAVGSPQSAGTGFTIIITGKDQYENTVSSYSGSNSLSDSTGTIAPTTTGSFSSGVWSGSVTITKAQTGILITTMGGSKSGSSNSFTVNPAVLDHFTLANVTTPQTAGTPITITISARDAYGNLVTGYTGIDSLRDSTGTISPTTTGAFRAGVWTGNVTITKANTGVTITVFGSGAGASNSFDVNPGTLDRFTFAAIGGLQTAGTPFSITITAKDAFNNTVTSYSSSNSLLDLTGTINPSSTGAFSFGAWSGSVNVTKAQSGITITTTGGGKTGTSSSFTVDPAALDHFTFDAIANPQLEDTLFATTIRSRDAYNNLVPSYSGTNSLTDSTGSIAPTSAGPFASGVWSGSVSIARPQTGVTITTSGYGKTGTSNSFDVLNVVVTMTVTSTTATATSTTSTIHWTSYTATLTTNTMITTESVIITSTLTTSTTTSASSISVVTTMTETVTASRTTTVTSLVTSVSSTPTSMIVATLTSVFATVTTTSQALGVTELVMSVTVVGSSVISALGWFARRRRKT
ncbi:MAG: hypothetical protein V1857_03365, partial [archaeon]